MKYFLIFILAIQGSLVFAQSSSSSLRGTQTSKLYLKRTVSNGDFMEITYEITNAGFVELHLFDPEGKKLWIKGRVTNRNGVDVIRVPRKPLKPEERYTFMLKYKGQDYNGTFYAD